MICFQIANQWHYGWRMMGTMWGPQAIKLFINPINYSYLRRIINHSYWSYLHQLSYRLGASHGIYTYSYIPINRSLSRAATFRCHVTRNHPLKVVIKMWGITELLVVVDISKSTEWAGSIPIFESNSWDWKTTCPTHRWSTKIIF